jgi:hypothetical protein
MSFCSMNRPQTKKSSSGFQASPKEVFSTSKSDLRNTTNFARKHISDGSKFGHT